MIDIIFVMLIFYHSWNGAHFLEHGAVVLMGKWGTTPWHKPLEFPIAFISFPHKMSSVWKKTKQLHPTSTTAAVFKLCSSGLKTAKKWWPCFPRGMSIPFITFPVVMSTCIPIYIFGMHMERGKLPLICYFAWISMHWPPKQPFTCSGPFVHHLINGRLSSWR